MNRSQKKNNLAFFAPTPCMHTCTPAPASAPACLYLVGPHGAHDLLPQRPGRQLPTVLLLCMMYVLDRQNESSTPAARHCQNQPTPSHTHTHPN